MALQSGLKLKCYTIPPGTLGAVVDYSREVVALDFSTVSPGGYGELNATLNLVDARLPRPELQLFSRVVVLHGSDILWIGEIIQPAVSVDDQAEAVKFQAIGIGNWLRDDPRKTSYNNKTIAQILTSEYNLRSAWSILSSDLTAISPTNPATTYSPAYDGNYMEEVIADVALLDGDDDWGVLAPPTGNQGIQTDAAGFPLGRIYLKARDTSTTHYTASIAAADITKHSVQQAADRCYNVVQVEYSDNTQTPTAVGLATYTDPRLSGSGAQGTAPFRRRLYQISFAGVSTVTKTVAQAIANTYGAQFQNISGKHSFTLTRCYNGFGAPLDLYRISAGHNIFVPELSPRGNVAPTAVTPGVNQFFALQVKYSEDAAGNQTVQMDCDNYIDRAAIMIARLQLKAQAAQRQGQKTTGTVQKSGASEVGGCGGQVDCGTAGHVMKLWQPFRAMMANVPTVALSGVTSTNITGSPTATGITIYGFFVTWTATNTGTTAVSATYTTSGN